VVNDEEEGVSLRLSLLLQQPLNQAKLTAAKISHRWAPKATPDVHTSGNPNFSRSPPPSCSGGFPSITIDWC